MRIKEITTKNHHLSAAMTIIKSGKKAAVTEDMIKNTLKKMMK